MVTLTLKLLVVYTAQCHRGTRPHTQCFAATPQVPLEEWPKATKSRVRTENEQVEEPAICTGLVLAFRGSSTSVDGSGLAIVSTGTTRAFLCCLSRAFSEDLCVSVRCRSSILIPRSSSLQVSACVVLFCVTSGFSCAHIHSSHRILGGGGSTVQEFFLIFWPEIHQRTQI